MKVYRVKLTSEERVELQALLSKGKASARTLMHARILLKTDEGVDGPHLTDDEIAEAVEVNRSTVERVRIRCVEGGVEAALRPRPSRQVHPRKPDGGAKREFVYHMEDVLDVYVRPYDPRRPVSVWTRPACNWWPKRARRCRWRQASQPATTTSMSGTVSRRCS